MQRGNPNLDALGGMLCLILGVVVVAVLAIMICYLLTLQKALSRVAPHNRLMEPAYVWLMLIPCFNIIWQFFIATRVPGSLQNEFRERGRDDGSDYGKSIALTQAILGIVSSFISNGLSAAAPDLAQAGSCVSGIMSLIGLVLFIVFWVKIANYSSQLASDNWDRGDDLRRGFDKYDDDRDSPRGGPSRPSPETYREDDPRYQP
jgi:hypothetical protein